MQTNKKNWANGQQSNWKNKGGATQKKWETTEDSSDAKRLRQMKQNEEIDEKYGYSRHTQPAPRIAWLVNMHTGDIMDEEKRVISCVDYYFMEEDGSRFKVSLSLPPYFYVASRVGCEKEVSQYLSKKYAGLVSSVETVDKEDLDLANHLVGLKRTYLKLSFWSVFDLMKVKKELMPKIRKNKKREDARSDYTEMLTSHMGADNTVEHAKRISDQTENIIDIREHDVPYRIRVSIDLKIFVGLWYTVYGINSERKPEIKLNTHIVDRPDPVVLAFDIETTKLPLKFPDSSFDQIMMISYMIDGQGYLIVNRDIVSADVEDFEYTPKSDYPGEFTIFNVADEKQTLITFFEHIVDVKPHIMVTYNGDFFDWPFVEARATFHGLNMLTEIGFEKDTQDEYKCRPCSHMDAFRWVKRDSYLPVGSQNLKACTRAKLRYDPVELDPEEMCKMAREQPQVLASYSVSDAVATYYLYMKYVHPFIFALCTIIPLEPDEVLRKGSGTLCEALLMVEAYHANIIFPNKQEEPLRKMTDDGHLMESETYVGGHVEALESGVFRADIACRFRLVPAAFQQLVDAVSDTMQHALEVEEKVSMETVTNFDEICDQIRESLESLRDQPARLENPIIYHLDVAAMYPNIILTNRLQPPAIVNETTCATCDFNKPGERCQRDMEWMWRGEIVPANRSEYQRIVQQLENEKFSPLFAGGAQRAFHQLSNQEQVQIERKRLTDYCRKAYRRGHDTRTEKKTTTICQRENSFYVDTVRAFRDRRYEYKGLLKVAKKKLAEAQRSGDASQIKSCQSKEILYDSLQLAHKCILNSFYGYVMRKGSRWFSMEMAGIVCYTGANIITKARELIEQIGRPLELDTDGIWCVLPASFPENVTFVTSEGRKVTVSYPGAMLNVMVQKGFTNDQYHELVDVERHKYEVKSENSIFFEVDGPYLAMVLPAAKEEGKKLKKRYAVFNFDHSLAELKGFEVKRRGELDLIKIFQSSVFEAFLKGQNLNQVYENVAKSADYWLDVLYSKAADMPDSELFDLISENRSMSKKLADYGQQKSTSITTAKRLAEFLGDQMVKDAGLACRFVISRKPEGAPVTERAVPLAIFHAEASVRRHYLRKWLKLPALAHFDIRQIIDWDYYIERLGSAIQKIITIPAALQGVSNPVPRVRHPDWLHKKMVEKNDVMRQRRITDMFERVVKQRPPTTTTTRQQHDNSEATLRQPDSNSVVDVEDIAGTDTSAIVQKQSVITTRKRKHNVNEDGSLYRSWRDVLGTFTLNRIRNRDQQKEWLIFQKRKWLHQSKQRAERRRLKKRSAMENIGSSAAPPLRTPLVGMANFMHASASSLLTNIWQVIQVVETCDPGEFLLWTLVGAELHKIKLKVPRIFYVNQKIEKEQETDANYRRVYRVLPRANVSHFLYEYRVPEESFQQHINEINGELSAPHVEGVYETQVPLLFRVLTQIGCLCQISEQRRKQLRGKETDVFSFEDLEFRTMAQLRYLDDKSMRQLYLYSYAQDSRSMWCLFIPATRKAHVWIVDRVRHEENMPNFGNLYNNERNAKLAKDPEAPVPKDNHQFQTYAETNVKEAYRGLQKVLRAYREERRGPSFVAVQSHFDTEYLSSVVSQLKEMPVVKLHVNDSSTLYSGLDWLRVGAKRMIHHYLNSNVYLDAYADLCRYLHIPLGNVPRDATSFGADLFFARHLIRQNHLLWSSPTDRPDFGGKQKDDSRLVADAEEVVSCWKSPSSTYLVNAEGFYPGVCVELDVASLPVSALLQSQRIAECEGNASAVGFDQQQQLSIEHMVAEGGAQNSIGDLTSAYDSSSLAAPAFRVLKHVVHEWVKDIAHHRNIYADEQIVHFYRWLRSPSSLLYEPALQRDVQSRMRKLLLLLIAELRRLGAVVVHATFGRLLVYTHKATADDARAYLRFVIDALGKKQLFATLDIAPNRLWTMLYWLHPANYGGVLEGEKENVDGIPPVDMHWNMMSYLPEQAGCQINFKMVVAGYLLVVYKHMQQLRTEKETQQTKSEDKDLSLEDRLGSFSRQLISGEMTQKLLGIIEKIQHKITVDVDSAPALSSSFVDDNSPFPKLLGSHLPLKCPALELAKMICKVLSLDKNVDDEVDKLRRDLFRLLRVDEFSEVAEWTDPCLSYILPEVICKHCNHCRDVDLCRDRSIESSDGKTKNWRCVQCLREYDTAELELTLVQHLNKLSMAFTLQDLKCRKCKEVKQSHMTYSCECCGRYQHWISKEDFGRALTTFGNLARFAKMVRLSECVDWLVAANKDLQNAPFKL